MKFVLAIAEDEVPSTKASDPYMHVFLDAGSGNILAFFELPTQAHMDRDRNTPQWVQHLALKVVVGHAHDEWMRRRFVGAGFVGLNGHKIQFLALSFSSWSLAIAIWDSVPFTYHFVIPNRNSGEEPVVCRQHSCCTGDSRFLTRLQRVRNDS